MKALFPYIGESILRAIIESEPLSIVSTFLPDYQGNVEVLQQVQLAFPAARISFDGFQNLDIGLLINQSELFPVEVKLGRKGLHRANIDKMLQECTLSGHKSERRVAGNMLAVLNRSFDPKLRQEIGTDTLQAAVHGSYVPVTETWGIIARSSILDSWRRNPPRFNDKRHAFSLEEICNRYGRDKFNMLVAEQLRSEDYFKDWIEQGG